jgi:hypothetical protein
MTLTQAHRDGIAIVGVNVAVFGVACALWLWLWPPGVALPIACAAWRLWKACS